MHFHSYLIPFFNHSDTIEVLLAKRKVFNSKDGFIHNNPGQIVLCGGYITAFYRKDLLKEETIRKFAYDTGFQISSMAPLTELVFTDEYVIYAYEVESLKEYQRISQIRNNYYGKKQIDYLQWYDIHEAHLLFENSLQTNPPCNGRVRECAIKYLNSLHKFREIPYYEFRGLKKHFKRYGVYFSRREVNEILNCLANYIQIRPYTFDKVLQYLELYMFKRSKVDWFAKGLMSLRRLLDN